MIYGRKQGNSKTKKTWDYVACYYPIGNISTEYNMFFYHEYISEVIFTGYINGVAWRFKMELYFFVYK